MNFIYHHRTAGRGAEGLHIASIVRALQRAGHTVTVISPPGVDPLETAGGVPLDKGAKSVKGFQRLWKWISAHCPQLVFEVVELAYNLFAPVRLIPAFRRDRSAVYYERYAFFLFSGVLMARLFGRPSVVEVNEITGIARARGQVMVPLAQWIERKVLRAADTVVVVSSFLREELIRRGVDADSILVIPNAIDRTRFQAGDMGPKIRQQLGLDGATVVGFVGWFDRWDRLDLLVDVVASLRGGHPLLRLVLVGDGPVAEELRAKIEEAGLQEEVRLTGPVPRDEVPHYIDAMDICVLPDSNPFGSPIVLFEFMARGKAVVAPDILPVRDVVVNRQTGIIVKRQDLPSLTRAICELVENESLRAQIGSRARSDVFSNYTWDANAERVVRAVQGGCESRVGATS